MKFRYIPFFYNPFHSPSSHPLPYSRTPSVYVLTWNVRNQTSDTFEKKWQIYRYVLFVCSHIASG
jgi:hypothetical protein